MHPVFISCVNSAACGTTVCVLSRKFWSGENFGPGDQNSRKIGPPGPKYSEKFGPYSEKGSGLDFARARPISQCDSVEFYVEVCGEYEKTMPVS